MHGVGGDALPGGAARELLGEQHVAGLDTAYSGSPVMLRVRRRTAPKSIPVAR